MHGEPSEHEADGGLLVARKEEDVGEDVAVVLLVGPEQVEQVYVAYACHLERLVHVAFGLVASYLLVAVEKEEGLYDAVAQGVAVWRGVVAQHDGAFLLDGLVECADVVSDAFLHLDVVDDVEVVDFVELVLDALHLQVLVAGLVE